MLMTPHIVVSDDRPSGSRVLSEASCETMRDLMLLVVEDGTGTRAAMDGFAVAGKTGTAQKAVGGRGYVDGKYTSLFAGFFPADEPEIVGLVMLDEVKTAYVGGGSTSAPIFHEMATRIVLHERMLPSSP
jgi:cell division protein FtsI/penicillin-binding protein 2